MSKTGVFLRLLEEQDSIFQLINHDASHKDMPKILDAASVKLQTQALQIATALKEGMITSTEFDTLNYCYKLANAKHKYLKETEKIEREWREKHEKDY